MPIHLDNISITKYSWQDTGSGSMSFADDAAGSSVRIRLTQDEINELYAVGYAIFERRQPAIAKGIADMKPALLPSPQVVEGEYTDVAPATVDDVPF